MSTDYTDFHRLLFNERNQEKDCPLINFIVRDLRKDCPQITLISTDYFLIKEIKKKIVHRYTDLHRFNFKEHPNSLHRNRMSLQIDFLRIMQQFCLGRFADQQLI